MARQTLVRDAESLANVMAVDGAKHGVRGGKGLPATGLAMSPIPALIKRPRFKTPRACVWDGGAELAGAHKPYLYRGAPTMTVCLLLPRRP